VFGKALVLLGASTVAGHIDALFWGVTLVAIVFSTGIFAACILLALRYRQGNRVDRSHPPLHNVPMELAWTIIPLFIVLGIFAWNVVVYFHTARVPDNALQVQVVGKQWMWKMQHPTGKWENNRLHVPVGRPVALNMTSEDVIHAFYIPAFRVKKDVMPGEFTQMWFQATKPGEFHIFCAEFCGTEHSTMIGKVIAMEPADYDAWLNEGDVQATVAAEGAQLFRKHGCSGCHAGNSSVRAPLLEGIYGRPIPVQVPKPGVKLEDTPAITVTADVRYLHDAILLPEREIAAGYKKIMPTFKGKLTQEEVLKLVAYIRTLGKQDTRSSGVQKTDNTDGLSESDYKARTGFVPENMKNLSGGGAGAGN
jgi:cytochrome c oxidase subunit 2